MKLLPSERRLLRKLGRALVDHRMLEPGQLLLVAVSGGTDSLVLLHLLGLLRRKFPLELLALHVDIGHPRGRPEEVARACAELGVPCRVERQDIWTAVSRRIAEGRPGCSLCSRLRRGVLWRVAREEGAQRLATAHHRDDFVETLLLNAFYQGRLMGMAPVLRAEDGLALLRPLLYCSKAELVELHRERGLPGPVPLDCGQRENPQRRRVRRLLDELEREHPDVRQVLLHAMANVRPSHLLDPHLRRLPAEESGEPRAGELP